MYTMSYFEGLNRLFAPNPIRPARRRGVIAARIRRQKTLRQLRHAEELPDYLLEDIGLTRSDLRRGRDLW